MNEHFSHCSLAVQRIVRAYHDPSVTPLRDRTPQEARAFAKALTMMNTAPMPKVGAIRDVTLNARGMAGRLIMPPDEARTQSPLPLLVWCHGGGWVIGSMDTSMRTARQLARATGVAVLNIEYRLAPEHPFPAAIDDAFDAVRWAAENASTFGCDPKRIAVGGDSCGGNLAAVCALASARAELPALAAQLLVYPVVDDDITRPSFETYGSQLILETEDMTWYWNLYCAPGPARKNWRARPIHAESFRSVPPAVIVIAEFDPLRSEVESYAEKLDQDDVPVERISFEKLPHAALSIAAGDSGVRQTIVRMGNSLARLLASEATTAH